MVKNLGESMLRMVEILTRSNAIADEKHVGACPIIFHQPKRPMKSMEKVDDVQKNLKIKCQVK